MMSIKVLVVAASLAFGSTALATKSYTMSDLEALAKDGAWDELMAHAMEIEPSGRTSNWKDLIEKAAVEKIKALKDDDFESMSPEVAQEKFDHIVGSFPWLKTSKSFEQAKNLAMIKALKACLNDSYCMGSDQDWLRRIDTFVKQNEKDKGAACAAGQVVMTRMVAYAALPSFEVAVSGGASSACCKVPEVRKAIESGATAESYKETAQNVAKKCGIKLNHSAPKKN